MKKLLTALVFAGGVGLAGSAAIAAPVSTPGLGLNVQSLIQPAQYYGGGGYGGGGYGYRQHYRPACHYVRKCSGYHPYQHCWRERVCH